MSYVYEFRKDGEPPFVVGFYRPPDTKEHVYWVFAVESAFATSKKAAARVHYLNGGSKHADDDDEMVRVPDQRRPSGGA